MYVKTMKKIINHIEQKYDNPQDILRNLDSKKIIDTEKPAPPNALDNPDIVTPTSEEIF